jgi:hypothetical protein
MIRTKSKATRRRQGFGCVFFALVVLTAPSLLGQSGARLTPAEKKIVSSLDADRVAKDIQHLSTGIVDNDSGAGAGSATGGGADEKKIADWVGQEMKSIGLTVNVEPFPHRYYEWGKVSLRANGKSLEAIGGGTWGTKDGVPYARGNAESGHWLRTILVDVGNGFASDYAKVGDVHGKAVLLRAGFGGGPVALEAAHRGAAAIIHFNDGDALDDALQGGPSHADQLPTVLISKKSGMELEKQVQSGPVNIELEGRIDVSDGTSHNVIGVMKGTEFPDEWVMVSAHYDRWWHSAQDNAAGVAIMLEMARALAGRYQTTRSFIFLADGSEESGMEDGAWALIQAHPEVMRRLVYDCNMDQAGWTATKGRVLTSPEVVEAQKQIIADLGLSDRITVIPGQDAGTDAWNFGAVGGGSTSLMVWQFRQIAYDYNWDPQVEPKPYFEYNHSQFDLYHPEDYKNILPELEVNTLPMLRMDEPLNVPIRLTDVASWANKILDSDTAKVPDVSFSDVRAALSDFRSEAEKVESLQKTVTSAAQAKVINDLLMNTRNNLMPWLYSYVEGSFRITRYANTLAAIEQARVAAEKGDRPGAIKSLESIEELAGFPEFSPEVQQEERLDAEADNGWGRVYQLFPLPPSPELVAAFRDLSNGGDVNAKESLRTPEAQAKANLSHSLWMVAGHLRAATESLRTARLD